MNAHLYHRGPFSIFLINALFILLFTFGFPAFSPAQQANRFHPGMKGKQFSRSELFVSSRADSSGSMGSYLRAMNAISIMSAEREVPGNHNSAQWYPLGPMKNTNQVLSRLGLVSSLWIDTTDFRTIYAGSNTGGIFRTTDGGLNWSSLSDNVITTGVLSIQVDPTNKDLIYIGTGHLGFGRAYGNGVMKSSDGGLTWEETGLNSTTTAYNFTVRKLFLLPQNPQVLIALANTEFRYKAMVFRSADGGQTWEEVYSSEGGELFSIRQDPFEPEVLYVGGNRFLKSTDAGITWVEQSQVLPLEPHYAVSRLEIAKTSNKQGLMLAMAEVYDTTGANPSARLDLFKSSDNGQTFRKLALEYNPFAGYWKLEFGMSPADTNEFYLGGIWLYKFRISGDSAKYIYCSDHKYHHDIRDLHIFSTGGKDLVYMANDGGVTRSETGAESWEDITRNGMNITQFHKIAIGENSDMMFAGPQDANLCFYNFKTGEWTKNAKISDAYGGAIDYVNPNNVYLSVVTPSTTQQHIFLLKSVDGGNYFEFRKIPDSTEVGRTDKPIEMDPVDPQTLYTGFMNVWKSTDGGDNWQKISNFPPELVTKIKVVKVAPSNNKVIAAAFENPDWGVPDPAKLWITPDGGNHWVNITPVGSTNLNYAGISDITFHPQQPQRFWLSLDREWADHRVYMTTDGGASWISFSEGLPAIPVNTIAFVSGAGYDVLLAATDAGVYYRDENMDRWELFGTGLPRTIVSDIKISYTRKKIVAGTFGRGLWECDLCLPLLDHELVISDTTEWNSKAKVLQDVRIEAGGRLNVSSVIEMGIDRTIRVMPGGELVIDRGTLTNDCAGMWNGIRVYGSTDYNDPTTEQGRITLLHGGSIQFADTAIKYMAIDQDGNPLSLSGGGIVSAENARFINNKVHLEINPSKGNNPSIFSLCQFNISKKLPDGSGYGPMVILKSNKGVSFTSCQFENNIPVSEMSFHERGTGIQAFNSSFAVNKLQSVDSVPFGINTEAVFKQLAYGIRATSSFSGFPVYVSEAKFDRNLTGICLSGIAGSFIADCNFNLNSGNLSDSVRPAASAIYLNNCNLFTVRNNTIKGPLGAFIPKSKSAGIVLNSCGGTNETIFSNRVTNLNYAILAQNNNRSADGRQGLRFLHNWFDKNEYDLCVTNDSTETDPGIALHQGSPGNEPAGPAGNRFSYSKLNRSSDIHNDGAWFYYHSPDTHDSLAHIPLNFYRIFTFNDESPFPSDSAYTPEYLKVTPENASLLLADLKHLSSDSDSLRKELTDGGNTDALISRIRQCTQEEAPQLVRELLKFSPYLSEGVLLQLINSQEQVPTTLIADVLAKNPQIARSPEILGAIETMDPKLTAYMIVALYKGYGQLSSAEALDAKTEVLRSARDLVSQLVAVNLMDADNQNYLLGNAVTHLLEDQRLASDILAAGLLLNGGDETAATGIMADLEMKYPEVAKVVVSAFSELYQLNKINFGEGKLPSVADSVLIEQLHQMKADPHTGIWAKNILTFLNNGATDEPFIFPGNFTFVPPPVIPEVSFDGYGFMIYPIPARNYVIFDYFSPAGFSRGELKIVAMNGQEIRSVPVNGAYGQQLIDISSLQPGVYLFRLTDGAIDVGIRKVVISR